MYIFGEGTNQTYGDLQAKRRIAQQLQPQQPQRNPFLDAITATLYSPEKKEPAKTPVLEDRPKLSFGAPPASPGSQPASSGSRPASVPSGEMAARVRAGLVGRGLPEHVADAFIVNFQDESGLDPGINEIAPIVPGSRGGFGFYQLTGPRRTAYEAFAAERGVDPSDVDAQLDWLMYELEGPEARAASSILAAPDKATAAVEIVNRFLRPAEEHRRNREARYRGLR